MIVVGIAFLMTPGRPVAGAGHVPGRGRAGQQRVPPRDGGGYRAVQGPAAGAVLHHRRRGYRLCGAVGAPVTIIGLTWADGR